jgi:ribonuclease P protein component
MTEAKKKLGLQKSCHLKHSSDFKRLRENGNRLICGCLVFNWMPLAEDSQSKIGVVTSRRLGSAVTRNRARRVLREVYRIHQYELAQPAEIVLVARNSIKESGFCDVERDFLKALHKAGLLRDGIKIN